MSITNKSERMGEEKIAPLLIKMSIPAIIGMVIQSLYNIIDSIYIGKVSTEALSALSLAFPIQIFLISIAVGTGVGTSSVISRFLGAGKKDRAENVAEHVFFISIIYGILVFFIGMFFSDQIVHLFTSDPQLIALAGRYIKIILVGSLAIFIPAIFNYILRGEGNTVAPMITMLIGAILNIILDPFFIFGIGFFPELGIEGAAYATVIARAIGGVFITSVLLSEKNELQLTLKKFKFSWQIIKEIYSVGIPAMLNRFLFSVSLVIINRILGSFNTTAIAVMGVVFRLQSFFLMSVFGLNQGYLPIVGYNYGHKNPRRMQKTILLGGSFALGFGTLAFVLFQLLPGPLLKLFNQDPEFLKIGIGALGKVSFAYLFMVLNIVGTATFQAMGKGGASFIVTFSRQAVLLLPGMYILGQLFGLDYTWLAFPLAEFIAFIFVASWLFLTVKKESNQMLENS